MEKIYPACRGLLLTLVFGIASCQAFGQCNALSSRRDIFFTPTFGCAPTSVTRFEITYYFTLPQNPADIQIQYVWNDPANTVTTVDSGSGLVAGAGNTSFTANATFTYLTNNGQCSIRPTVSVIVAGVLCPTSTQVQTAPYWGTDDQANGVISMTPATWNVCFDNAVVNAVFRDNSDFNCNIGVEPDNPNRLTRNVQFVYGTNNAAATTIRNLSLNNGAPQNLTDGAGNLVTPQTRGTAGLLVTAGFFGPVDTVPFPADAPTSVSFPMNAPANLANLIGYRFEITLFNWNVCNPWNGDPVNPNYQDARTTTGYIVIVAAPAPNFDARDSLGNSKRDFCINEKIYLANLTPNVNNYAYTWEYFDDPTGTTLLSTSNTQSPTYAYATGGTKLIRLEASNPTAQGSCNETFDLTVNITPTLVAKIGTTDLSNVTITPDFCQQASPPLTTFPVRFHDNSVGTVTATTQWRWEFYDQNNVLVQEEPGPGTYSDTPLGPYDLSFTTPGVYHEKLIVRDKTTGCFTTDEVAVYVYPKPVPLFTASPGCEGLPTQFTENSTLTPINGESIVLREWDFNYNGVTFNKDPAYDNQSSFTRLLGPAGNYTVALRVTTNQNACSDILAIPVQVYPLPNASFTENITSGCSVLKVTFINTSVAAQPDTVSQFIWEIDQRQGLGFQAVATQRPTDPGFSDTLVWNFKNITTAADSFDIRLHVVSKHGCERIATPVTIIVFPGTASGFSSPAYSPFNNNCSPQRVDFTVDGQTQSLNPVGYEWQVRDNTGIITDTTTGTNPAFSHTFVNSTQAVENFDVTLITTLPSGCSGDSTRTIRISPVPASGFTIDTTRFDCLNMNLLMSASQKGLDEYDWQIFENGVLVVSSTNANDTIGYHVQRPAPIASDIQIQVTLTARNFANCVGNPTTQTVTVPKQDNLNTSFTVTPLSQSLPNATVTITNTTNSGSWQYKWAFGDSSTSTSAAATLQHTYATYGTYTITLTVTDNVCIQKATQTVVIQAIPPVVDFDYAPPSGCIPLTVTFTNLSRYADPSTYTWDFGQGQGTSQAVDPTFTYFQPGQYTVSLSASNITGQTVKTTKLLIIDAFARPSAQFDVRPKVVYIPGGLLYTSNQSMGATTYLWDFGDGTTSNAPQPEHEYKNEGLFTVTLIATNNHDCSDTTSLQNAVDVQKGGQVLIPNAFTPNVPGGGAGGNSNGKNDIFLPLTRGVVQFELMIFNRWGELLFDTRDPQQGWDGYYNGKLCQQDVYVYKLSATYDNGQQIVRMGDVTLIR